MPESSENTMGLQSSGIGSTFSTCRGLIISITCLLAVPFLSMGCDSFRNGASDSKKSVGPVEAEFNWAMERLRRAIETFTPQASHNLRVKRELSFEFFPPTESKTDYTAKVLVESNSTFMPQRLSPNSDAELKQAEESRSKAAESSLDEEFTDDPENDPTTFLDEYEEGLPEKPKIVNSLVKAPSIKERIVYELVYRDEHWQLTTQPESKHEQLWFDYALQQ